MGGTTPFPSTNHYDAQGHTASNLIPKQGRFELCINKFDDRETSCVYSCIYGCSLVVSCEGRNQERNYKSFITT